MAFYEWRRFNFFDLNKEVDEGKLAEVLQNGEVTTATSGNSQLVFGNSVGQLHIVTRTWSVTTFRGYEIRVIVARQLKHSPLLVTIGEDEVGINPVLKVWDTSRKDKQGAPVCVRITRTIPMNRPVEACCVCVHDGLQLLAVGFVDGSLILYRGDITRDRSTRQKVLRDGTSPITGLSFKSTANSTLLYVATSSSVFLYNITHKDKEYKIILDTSGCAHKCSLLAESVQDGHFMVARDDAIYCYTTDGRGPCYAVDGEKVLMEWFRSYLVIISKTVNRSSATSATVSSHLITVLDLQNKFIVFSSPIQDVKAVLSEWGSFYILGGSNEVYHLDEKDLQSKLSLLFKKNLYDVAIRIAKSQQYDSDGLIDIFRQYGDHLYNKGDAMGAVEQYIKTIGKLESSYVIRKFLDSQYIIMLIRYLQALHKQGHATEDHTTLLLNCYKKEDKTEELKEFIMTKDRELDFDVEIAIKVCRQVSIEDALNLAKKHRKHDWYLKIQIEDNKKYSEGLDYISNLSFEEAELYMKKYGNVLIENVPAESTQFLKKLCSDYRPENKPLVSESMLDGSLHIQQKADPENYIHLFLNNSTRLVEFLEYLVADGQTLSTAVYDTLLEHYLHVWGSLEQETEKNTYEQNAVKLLQNPDAKYDKHQALVVCHMHKFSSGILHLYEEQKQYQQILAYHLARKDSSSVLACCRRFGQQEPSLWLQALWACVKESTYNQSEEKSLDLSELLEEILRVVAKERLLSPMFVVDALGSGAANITLCYVRDYIISELEREENLITSHTELINKYKSNTNELRQKIHQLKTGPVTFQGSRCSACHQELELPSLHFLCQHSYHQHCFQSYSDNENECPACQPKNKEILDLLKAREPSKNLDEKFHSLLEKAPDGFSVTAEYFGRSVFNKVTIVTEPSVQKVEQPVISRSTDYNDPFASFNKTSEGRLRQAEGKSKTPTVIPIPEGRMRLQETRYNSSLEANLTRMSPKTGPRDLPKRPSDIFGSSITSKSSKAQTYDETKNPFAEDSTNPFENDDDEDNDDEDYDKNLNPFAV